MNFSNFKCAGRVSTCRDSDGALDERCRATPATALQIAAYELKMIVSPRSGIARPCLQVHNSSEHALDAKHGPILAS